MRFSPHFQLFYFNDRLEFCEFFKWKIKRINNADLFSQPPLLIFTKGANISGGHCTYGEQQQCSTRTIKQKYNLKRVGVLRSGFLRLITDRRKQYLAIRSLIPIFLKPSFYHVELFIVMIQSRFLDIYSGPNFIFENEFPSYSAFPLHGTARYSSLLWGFPLGTVPGTFFSTTSVEVPSEPNHYQNVTCKLCWSLIGQRKSSLPASLNLRHETQQAR